MSLASLEKAQTIDLLENYYVQQEFCGENKGVPNDVRRRHDDLLITKYPDLSKLCGSFRACDSLRPACRT
jgi:hypothetical protein